MATRTVSNVVAKGEGHPMDSPALWAGIWLAVAATFVVGEILIAGSFFMAPLAVGAFFAGIASLFGAPLWLSWGIFVVGSVAAFLALRPLAERLDIESPAIPGIGANRLVGMTGVVTADVAHGVGSHGSVKVEGETWRAEGRDGMGIPLGTSVRIVEVKGTRVVVEPSVGSPLT